MTNSKEMGTLRKALDEVERMDVSIAYWHNRFRREYARFNRSWRSLHLFKSDISKSIHRDLVEIKDIRMEQCHSIA